MREPYKKEEIKRSTEVKKPFGLPHDIYEVVERLLTKYISSCAEIGPSKLQETPKLPTSLQSLGRLSASVPAKHANPRFIHSFRITDFGQKRPWTEISPKHNSMEHDRSYISTTLAEPLAWRPRQTHKSRHRQ